MTERTLRDRLHEFFHIGDRATWTCGGDIDACSLNSTAITPMARLISDWLDDQGLVMTARGTVLDNADFEALAEEAEIGYDVVDGRLVAKQPAVVGVARRQANSGVPRTPEREIPFDLRATDAMIAVLSGSIQRLPDGPGMIIVDLLATQRAKFIAASREMRAELGLD